MALVKFIIEGIILIAVLGFAGLIFPTVAGIFIGYMMIEDGNILGGIVAIGVGVLINAIMLLGGWLESGSTGSHRTSSSGSYTHGHDITDTECPYCGSSDTDGNHCFDCDEDF